MWWLSHFSNGLFNIKTVTLKILAKNKMTANWIYKSSSVLVKKKNLSTENQTQLFDL